MKRGSPTPPYRWRLYMAFGHLVDVVHCLTPARIYRNDWRFSSLGSARSYARWLSKQRGDIPR